MPHTFIIDKFKSFSNIYKIVVWYKGLYPPDEKLRQIQKQHNVWIVKPASEARG